MENKLKEWINGIEDNGKISFIICYEIFTNKVGFPGIFCFCFFFVCGVQFDCENLPC